MWGKKGKIMTNTKQAKIIPITDMLTNPELRISLHRRLHHETEEVHKTIEGWETQTTSSLEDVIKARILEGENTTKILRNSFMYGCYFGTKEQSQLWQRSLNRLGTLPHHQGSTLLIDFQIYPALLVLYAGGIGSISSGSMFNLKYLIDSYVSIHGRDKVKIIEKANCGMLGNNGNKLLGTDNRYTPLSDHLLDIFKSEVPEEIVFNEDIEDIFDRLEILISMAIADIDRNQNNYIWAPLGRFAWRGNAMGGSILAKIGKELEEEGDLWSPIKAGIFGSSSNRAKAAHEVILSLVNKRAF